MSDDYLSNRSHLRGYPAVEPVAASIIGLIPTRNEAAPVGRAIESVAGEASEVIVVGGGSTETTKRVAARAGARILAAPRGRGASPWLVLGLDAAGWPRERLARL